MEARIYQPAKAATQSGRGRGNCWVLEYQPAAPKRLDSLMGWTGSSDCNEQVVMKFETREAAETYADKRGIAYTVSQPRTRTVRAKSYADNFSYDRVR